MQYEFFDINSLTKSTIAMTPESNIVFNIGQEEVLKITLTGFYVKGVLVKDSENLPEEVYKSFKQWLSWALLNQPEF